VAVILQEEVLVQTLTAEGNAADLLGKKALSGVTMTPPEGGLTSNDVIS